MVQKWIFFTLLWIFALLPTGRVARNTTGKQREVVCGNIDIRNQVSSFDQLKNCTVIEGNLQILLLDYAEPDDYKHLSYPRLVEITDYLLLYRVYGLKSLSDIFPNLTVIRGQRLFHNYALVAYEMQDLENLGLRSLTTIVRGGVRLEKNSHLCYIDTLDWSIIASQVSENGHFFKDNQEIDKCVNICPRDSNNKDKCPTMKNNPKQALCWDEKHCQKVPQDCTHGDCCHRECLGGCYGKGADQCVACKNLLFEGRCWPECPLDTLQYRQHRCIKEDDCKKMGKSSLRKQTYWKIHNRHCLKECPYGFTESKVDKHKCEKCNGPCPKECVGHVVDSVASAQALKGCTVITGELEIQIRGGNHVGKELEINLGSIENITAYLKIVRSDAIMSLRFLKNLRVIDGKLLWNNKYSLVLVDNSNLEDIWDFNTHPNLTLKKGRMFIHHNRKLCMHIVRRLIAQVGLTNQTDNIDVSKTNGDQVACNVTTLNLEVIRTRDSFAVIRWNNFRTNDPRSLLSFVVNYRESPEKNLTMYTTRDACGTDVWKTEDVRPDSDRNAKEMITMLYPLEPWTQYAVYVLTYTVSSSSHGAISPIKYFTTEPAVPSPPTDIEVVARATGELTVSWKPPIKPNGNVTHYYVYWQPQPLNPRAFDRRNYCHDKLQLVDKKKKSELEEKEDGKGNKTDGNCCTCCTCPKSKKDQKREEAERLFQIEFQNSLHDSVYIKRPGKFKKNAGKGGRTKRSTNQWNKYLDMENTNWTMIADGNLSDAYINATAVNTSEEESIHLPYLSAMVYGTEILLPDLEHYKEYSIEVIACHEYDVQTEEKMCSNRGITAARTLPSLDADTIDPRNISVNNYTSKDGGGEVQLYWKEPASPNGLILTYEIEYKKVERKNIKPEVLCIPHKEYRVREGYVIKALPAGNYSFRIRATSLAGNGSWTVTKFFYLTDNKPTVESWRGEIIAGVATATGLVVVLGVAGLVWVVAKKRYNQNIPDQVWYASVNPEYVSAGDIYIADEWEVDRDKIKLIRELGQGSFGMVYEGTVKGLDGDKDEIKVAVKTVNENASIRDRIEFLNEASVMKGFICNHVVKLLGVVSKSQPTLVIMELMANGDLKTFLRKHRPEEEDNNGQDPPSLKRILQMAGEIADGMAYLADKKFVHRDLAARNCMVAENLIVKIGDFGMTRDIYETDYYRKGGKGLLPVRWMGPESLRDGVFTSMSDVWSYGIVLWEMATLAAQPYQGLANEQVLKYVIDGGLMEKPEGCPDKLYDLMVLCWKHNPKQRPTFQEIIEMLVPDLDPSFHELSYFFSEDNRHDRIDSEEDEKTPLKGSPSGPDLELDEVSIDNSYGRLSPGPKRSMYSLHSNCSKKHSPSQCDCVDIIKDADKVKRKGSRNSNCPGGIDVHSNDGSKESSKSSGSSHSRLNGMANGHIPIMPNYTEC